MIKCPLCVNFGKQLECAKCKPLNEYTGTRFEEKEVKQMAVYKREKERTVQGEKIDNVNHPQHYKETSLECFETMLIAFGVEAVAHYCCINAYKYMFRYRTKNGVEDLQKAEWYLNACKKICDDYNVFLPNSYKALSLTLKEHMKGATESEC